MAEFTLHVRLDSRLADETDGEALLGGYVEDYEGVEFGSATVEPSSDPDVIVPEQSSLEIEGVDTFATIYDELRREPAVASLNLWGPDASRFPVPVRHYGLQELEDPRLFEYHAIDDRVTLVIAESELGADKIRQDVPPSAIGYRQSPF